MEEEELCDSGDECNEADVSGENSYIEPSRKRRKMNGYICEVFTKEWNDIISIEKRGVFPCKNFSCARVCDDVVKFSFCFLFRTGHVQLLAWGTRRVQWYGSW